SARHRWLPLSVQHGTEHPALTAFARETAPLRTGDRHRFRLSPVRISFPGSNRRSTATTSRRAGATTRLRVSRGPDGNGGGGEVHQFRDPGRYHSRRRSLSHGWFHSSVADSA